MNKSDVTLHYLQIEIIKKLSLSPKLRFNDLVIEGLESEHMNYHLQKLLSLNFVEKNDEYYVLSDVGKDYSNLMDDDIKAIEKQPKSSILIRGIRKNGNKIEHLLTKRLRQPYYGKIGRVTGKIRFGERFQEAAARELFEETGLIAKTLVFEKIYHKVRYKEDGEYVQDVIFYVFFATDFEGELIKKLPYQENLWATLKEIDEKKFDLFDKLEIYDKMTPDKFSVEEDVGVADGF